MDDSPSNEQLLLEISQMLLAGTLSCKMDGTDMVLTLRFDGYDTAVRLMQIMETVVNTMEKSKNVSRS
jgi:hypothetical protein